MLEKFEDVTGQTFKDAKSFIQTITGQTDSELVSFNVDGWKEGETEWALRGSYRDKKYKIEKLS